MYAGGVCAAAATIAYLGLGRICSSGSHRRHAPHYCRGRGPTHGPPRNERCRQGLRELRGCAGHRRPADSASRRARVPSVRDGNHSPRRSTGVRDRQRRAHPAGQVRMGAADRAAAAGGTECDPRNYNPLEQRDNFCEIRSWSMPMCPGGVGHQGQDIRPATCKDNTWEVMAVVDGIITLVTKNTTVKLKGADGTVFEYLHMHPSSIKVEEGDKV